MRFHRASWLFNVGADVYAWFTAQGAWRESCARLASHLPAGNAPRIVDLGCGPGVSAIELARLRPDALVAGLDIAPRMLSQARRRGAAFAISWVRADAGQLPFASGSLDALTGHSFLYLLGRSTQTRALREMVRVLRPGGRVILMEPSARPATVSAVLELSRDPRHLISVGLWRPFSRLHGRFTAAGLATTLAGAGLVQARVEQVLGGLGLMAWADKPGR